MPDAKKRTQGSGKKYMKKEMTTEEKLQVIDFIIHEIKMYKDENKSAYICVIIENSFNFINTLEISFPELFNALQRRLVWLMTKNPGCYNYQGPALWRGRQYAERIKFLIKIKEKLLKTI